MGLPLVDDRLECVAMRIFREVFDPLQGVDGCEVTNGEDVRPL
jgi:hypothetical protein